MDSYDVLVIILSVTLAVFLLLGIIAMALSIQVLRRLRSLSESAQHAADNIEQFSEQLKAAGKASIIGSIASQIKNVFSKGGK